VLQHSASAARRYHTAGALARRRTHPRLLLAAQGYRTCQPVDWAGTQLVVSLSRCREMLYSAVLHLSAPRQGPTSLVVAALMMRSASAHRQSRQGLLVLRAISSRSQRHALWRVQQQHRYRCQHLVLLLLLSPSAARLRQCRPNAKSRVQLPLVSTSASHLRHSALAPLRRLRRPRRHILYLRELLLWTSAPCSDMHLRHLQRRHRPPQLLALLALPAVHRSSAL
jgi:hypothetical protein